ncbi:MAG: hypothetical protein JXA69_21265 [Phycisphaerae bacterium]|nr:hypothetical protein [Phycisphaerae bacterium]
MTDYDLDKMILVVVGTTIRAEDMDRPLANQLAATLRERLPADSAWQCMVVSDIYYINNEEFQPCPTISIGGPGVNHLSRILFHELPPALAVDGVLLIQMDMGMKDHRACIWGMDHDTTVEALETFLEKGYLDHYLSGILAADAL